MANRNRYNNTTYYIKVSTTLLLFGLHNISGWPICANMVGLDGHVPVKYGSTYTACPGYDVRILDDDNLPLPANSFGNIVIKVFYIAFFSHFF